MNEKKVKALRKKIKPLQVEWLKTLLNEEEAAIVDGWAVEDAEAVLRAHDCRATGPRVAVMRALLRHGGPIDAAELTRLAQVEESTIHEATVWSTPRVDEVLNESRLGYSDGIRGDSDLPMHIRPAAFGAAPPPRFRRRRVRAWSTRIWRIARAASAKN